MATLEERVIGLEARSETHTRAVEGLRQDIAALRGDLTGVLANMALRSETAALQRELAAVRAEMATRTDIGDLRREMSDLRNDMNRRSDLQDAKIDRNFVWLMGTMVTGFITIIGALVGVVYR